MTQNNPAGDTKADSPENCIEKNNGNGFIIRKADVCDVKAILDLVNSLAKENLMLPRGPQYLYENVRDFIVVVDENDQQNGVTGHAGGERKILACGSLHVLWDDIAEIRSLAMYPHVQKLGLGRRVVEYMIKDAERLGIKHLFTFTLADDFFKTLGFEKRNKEGLPPKVWGECSRCPKYFKCDEIGMIMEI